MEKGSATNANTTPGKYLKMQFEKLHIFLEHLQPKYCYTVCTQKYIS